MNQSETISPRPDMVWPYTRLAALVLLVVTVLFEFASPVSAQSSKVPQKAPQDAKHKSTGKPAPPADPRYCRFGLDAKTAPRAERTEPRTTRLPLRLPPESRVVLIGNTLWERAQHYGYFEAVVQRYFARHRLRFRNLAWSADTPDLQPRPDNFADVIQHLTHERADIILAAYGFNESFAGEAGIGAFQEALTRHVRDLKSRAFNGKSAPQVVLLSPTANENVPGAAAADRNNARLEQYVAAMAEVAQREQVGFVDLFHPTLPLMAHPHRQLTINGVHLNDKGYRIFADLLFRLLFDREPPSIDRQLAAAIVDKNRQFFRRYRPLNTFYYTGGRNKTYGYLDFLPAMENFEIMVANRDRRIWELAQGKKVTGPVDDSNLPPLPPVAESRGANRWLSAKDEQREFQLDPRFEVNLFAGEEQFPDIAAPIQMRWDARGRLWVSCSTTYPHVYPGNEPNDKIVILEDTDGDGRADKSTVFADDLHIPLSFEFGDGGVYVSEMPHLTFLKDTDGDDRADVREILLSGFGTEDSHHALHDFVWSPGGDLIFRDSIFLHSQIETPYGPIRMQNSGWFRFQPRRHRLTVFGSYPSTNPWGVTFDDWGNHVASHPIYAEAFHAPNPPYPHQHPRPVGLRAYSGTCGHEFVDFATFPEDMQGGFVKARYKPTNRIEIHRWKRLPFGYDEEYVGDLLFSTNLSFIPVDVRFGPRGALYICDWYNPIKGHMQYSLRDPRRDRHSGRIWRITMKGRSLQEPPKIAGASIDALLDLLKRREYRYRYWAKRELRERPAEEVAAHLDKWLERLESDDPRYRHHQLEALWVYRSLGAVRPELTRELARCEVAQARAATVKQLAFLYPRLESTQELLEQAAKDPDAIVRMEAAIAASHIATPWAYEYLLEVLRHPYDGHLQYALTCAVNSEPIRPYWEENAPPEIRELFRRSQKSHRPREPKRTRAQARFDRQPDLKKLDISCVPERMLFTVRQFTVRPGQPVKIVFTNPDATDHNLVFVRPGALAEVGMAANEMAKDPRNANSDFIPVEKKPLILHATPMIGPTRSARIHVLRFHAPRETGIYPYLCTFPGHWVVMNGQMVVAESEQQAADLLAAQAPQVIRRWTLSDFPQVVVPADEVTISAGMQAFVKARCHQCHRLAGHGVDLGPDLSEVSKRFRGEKLLQQILEPSSEIHKDFQTYQFLLEDGRVLSGVIAKETPTEYHVIANLLLPHTVTRIAKRDVERRAKSTVSAMPEGLLNVLTKEEILALLAFLEHGLPEHLRHGHATPVPKSR